jgi:hypothetical protein
MADPSTKLADSLEMLKSLQDQGKIAIRSSDLTRPNRERLLKAGFLQEVMKGWYVPAKPGDSPGESTAWYTSFWHFCAEYLNTRFGKEWVLSPEQSAKLHAGSRTVPTQLLVKSPKGNNQMTSLLHGTSLFEIRSVLPDKSLTASKEGLNLYSLPAALINCTEDFYTRYPTDARVALLMIRNASDILKPLLDGSHSKIAGRLAGAFRNIGQTRIADEILETMRKAGYDVRESDPFTEQTPVAISLREPSPYVNRVKIMWQAMRGDVINIFPPSPGLPKDKDTYMKQVSDNYARDAYNSLSIEGYRVSSELIERVRNGKWEPDKNKGDREQIDAMAARGYWLAYQAVQKSLLKILNGENAGEVTDLAHSIWYREMFEPSVTVGLLKPSDLAGYRNNQVYIRHSMHVPPNVEAVRDLMPAFFDLLKEEKEASVRVVLGHFVFVYIHPYPDGNGRIGRFLMNAMLASGGYPWTVVPLKLRDQYMQALEQASAGEDIKPFAKLIAHLAQSAMEGKMIADD